MISGADRRIRPAWVSKIHSKMLHRRFHDGGQAVRRPFPGEQRITARPESRAFEVVRSKCFNDLCTDPGSWRRHSRARAAQHEGHQERLHRGKVMSSASKLNLLNYSGEF